MARKAIVNKDIVLNMLREGETTQHIADRFKVSRQAIDLYRRDFIKRDLLPDQRAPRKVRMEKVSSVQNDKPIASSQYSHSKDTVSLDVQINLIIDAFSALKRLPQLKTELEEFKQKYDNALREIERLKEDEKKRLDQESRWLLTQQNSDSESG